MAAKRKTHVIKTPARDPRLGTPIYAIKWADGKPPTPVERIVEEILAIAKAMRTLDQSRLKRDTLITLLSARSGVGKRDIELVLNNLSDLEAVFLKPKVFANAS